MPLPLIPHSEIDPDCCGCLCEVVEDTTYFLCNECGARVSKEEVAPVILSMESTAVTCPHCGKLDQISGFSEVYAFVCQYCGRSVTLDSE